jgi:peptidoglycan/xylan/chitin deacetylase (PgdA/CDA1 family)
MLGIKGYEIMKLYTKRISRLIGLIGLIGLIRMVGLTLIAVLTAGLLSGCALLGGGGSSDTTTPQATEVSGPPEGLEPSEAIAYVHTTSREFSLTFNGMGTETLMDELLDKLDEHQIVATFFVPGIRVAEEPELANKIAARGHELENNTLKRLDLSKLSYDQVYKEIHLSSDIIKRETGVTTKYVRTRSGDYSDELRLAAAQSGAKAVVSYTLNLNNWKAETEEEKYRYVRDHITRGGIIALDTELNPDAALAIPIIARAAADIGYSFVPLSKLMEKDQKQLPLEQIPGYDAAKLNPDYAGAPFKLIYSAETSEKVVALTFDDWGTDYTVTKLLDILDQYDVKVTFYLRANGVERNPNLARALSELGHEIANHTYSHPVITGLTPAELQEEIVKGHRIMTEAIQHQPLMQFRPPTGAIDDEAAQIVGATGYHDIAMYDVTVFDWDSANDAKHIVDGIMEKTKPGSIILLHMLDDLHTIEALPDVITKLRAQGYEFMPVSKLLEQSNL